MSLYSYLIFGATNGILVLDTDFTVTYMASPIDYAIASPDQVMHDLGERLAQLRLQQNQTQEEVARRAGVSKRTIARLEGEGAASLNSFIRIVSALGLSANLQALIDSAEVRPMERVQHRGRERQRARSSRSKPPPFQWKQ